MLGDIESWMIAPIAAVASVLTAVYFNRYIKRQEQGTDRMRFVAEAIKEGAKAFLNRMYRTLLIFVAAISILLLIFLPQPIWSSQTPLNNIKLTLAYLFGSFCSALAGYLGMDVATDANLRSANAARKGLAKSFQIAFRGGAVMGLSVVGLALLGVSIIYLLTGDASMITGFSFGASAMALFAKAGGGIYTKTADIGADLVGKVEMDLPEDDPRNPAVVADNVGDNVGDVAGMGADLFDSYVASLMATIVLGSVFGGQLKSLSLVFAGVGCFAAIIGALSVKVGETSDPGKILNRGTYLTCAIYASLTLISSYLLKYDYRIWGASTTGLLVGIVIGVTSDYFTSINRTPARKTAEASVTGTAINIITGYSYGLLSVFPPLIGIGLAALVSYNLCSSIGPEYGVYGVGAAAFGMLSIVGMVVTNDSFGPIGDNAKGIAEQSSLELEMIDILDKLDAAGNTSKAITKGFAIGAAGLTVISILAAFKEVAEEKLGTTIMFDLMDPLVLVGALIGLAIPAIFSAQVMLGVGKNAFKMIEEVRRQFREISGLREGREGVKPDYARCVDIATKGALRELMPASIVAITTTLLVGLVFGIKALGGYLSGAIFSGLVFALLMSNAGALWDNAKKYIEEGALGGKGSEAHKAAVVGDTVGDPFKDTAGPSLNTLITVMGLVANVFLPLFIAFSLM
ncbi:sodium-translocating pyrophosphatase [Candidatus Bathyarchaeota archaeon]|nr:sodium-translocating pyrophosphatase [Candidatus Bathyarchaeota archaeon]MBS7630553.1 sodium-translocating pyrophosphatase [Candidatus Bathyarchaeota archaeon]